MNSYLIYLIKINKYGIKVRLSKKHACTSNTKYKKDKTKIIEVKKQVLKYKLNKHLNISYKCNNIYMYLIEILQLYLKSMHYESVWKFFTKCLLY